MTRPNWIDPPVPPSDLALHEDPLLAAVLHGRGLRTEAAVKEFLLARRRPAPDPFGLPGMVDAVARVRQALDNGERIAVFGDYDADGVTSTALLVRALRAAAGDPACVVHRLPTRAEGYGLSAGAISELAATGATLLVAVDCGSADPTGIDHARSRGLDVVVLDHHQMAGDGPDGAVVVSAQRLADDDPRAVPGRYRDLSAVGVAYLLVAGLAAEGCPIDGDGGEPETDLLDYVALGTVADVMPLGGMNRALVRDGLVRLRRRPRPGIRALCRAAGLEPEHVGATEIGFKLAPRLNAAGRMGNPELALQLLLCDDHGESAKLAHAVEALNKQRRSESSRVVAEAEALLRAHPDLATRRLVVLAKAGWNGGVLGIVAGRLAEKYGRPVLVLNDGGEYSRGSARSVPGFDITGALTSCRHLLEHHGGHGQAAGLTIRTDRLPELEAGLEAAVDAVDLAPLPPSLRIDADLPLDRLTLRTAEQLDLLAPFGHGNEAPLLRVRGARVGRYDTIGADRSHLKLHLDSPRGATALAWGAADRSRELMASRTIDFVCCLSVDHWGGKPRLQVEVKDFRPAE